MGYTHYYYVSQKYEAGEFASVVADFKKMLPALEHLGVKLADAFGENKPIINDDEIRFNGLSKCGHTQKDLGITWPAPKAKGILKNGVGTQLQQITRGNWFAGAQLESRVCGGDCSHETFSLERLGKFSPHKLEGDDFKNDGLIFECTKTAYKPYDLAVTVCLVIAKHHLKKGIKVSSDGEIENWEEAMQLCQHFLGYGEGFKLEE